MGAAHGWRRLFALLPIVQLWAVSVAAGTVTIAFDFTRASGDRDHSLGMHNPAGQFDYNLAVGSFQTASSVFRATTTGRASAMASRTARHVPSVPGTR